MKKFKEVNFIGTIQKNNSFVIAGAALALFKKAIDEQMQTVLYIIMGLCVVLAGGPMVINFFGFSGALIA